MHVWNKIRKIKSRFIYKPIAKRVLLYIYTPPGKTINKISSFINKYYLKYFMHGVPWSKIERLKNELIEDKLIWYEYPRYWPSEDASNSGLWLVNYKTGELLRPITIVEEIIGRFYRSGQNVFISLPQNKIYEVVDGFEYGAKIFSRNKIQNGFTKKKRQ